jgi:tetratricopeptide (TPR) repeat protein
MVRPASSSASAAPSHVDQADEAGAGAGNIGALLFHHIYSNPGGEVLGIMVDPVPASAILSILLLMNVGLAAAQGPESGERPAVWNARPEPSRVEGDRRQALELYGLGVLRLRQDRLVEALGILEEALKLDPVAAPVQRTLIPLYVALGRNDQALAASRKTVELDPDDFATWSLYARQLRSLGRLAEARDALVRGAACPGLAEHTQERLQMYYDLGALAEELNDFRRAAEAFTAVVQALDGPQAAYDLDEIRPADLRRQALELHERIVRLYIKAADFDRALGLFAAAQKKYPELTRRMQYSLAEVEAGRGRPEQARQYLEAYLRTQPQGIDAYRLWIKVLGQLQRQAGILPALEKFAANDAHHLLLQLLLAEQYAAGGRPGDARALYLRLAEEASAASLPEIYGGLFGLYERHFSKAAGPEILGLLNTAFHAGQKSKGAQADPEAAAKGRAMLAALQQHTAAARALVPAGLEAIHHGQPLEHQTCVYLAVLARRTDQLAEAEEFFRRCLADGADARQDNVIYGGLLGVLWEAHNYEAVVQLCRQGLDHAKAPNQLLFYENLARSLLVLGKLEEALAAADKAVEIANDDNRLWTRLLRLRIWSQAGRYNQALTEGQALLKQFAQPGDVREIRFGMYQVYTDRHDLAKAEEQLALVLKADPDDATANNDLGYLWADQGKNLEEAEKLIRKALDLDERQRKSQGPLNVAPEAENAAFVDSLGWVLFRRGRLGEARQWLEKACSLPAGKGDPTVWDHLGDVCAGLKDRAAARAAWQKALALYDVDRRYKRDDHYQQLKHKLEPISD